MGKQQIVILGGGVGALSAAFHLTEQPDWQARYDITVYSLGWRLGGKAASSRNPQQGYRIEEHGLHLWFGGYENAFAMLRKVYAELQGTPGLPFATLEQAFSSRDHMAMMDEQQGHWSLWPIRFPRRPGQPGVGARRYRGWRWLQQLLRPLLHPVDACLGPRLDTPHPLALLLRLARALLLRPLESPALKRSPTRRLYLLLDLLFGISIGALQDRLLQRGLRSIDDREFSAWLAAHGTRSATLASAVVRSIYTAGFFFNDGKLGQADLAAGCALGLYMRIGLLYRGHVCYPMNAGMGDVVITPLYLLLARRGVRFEFFSKVRSLELSPDRRRVKRVHFCRQMQLAPGLARYEPLAFSSALGSLYWPPEPLYAQLQCPDGQRPAPEALEASGGRAETDRAFSLDLGDADRLLLAISHGALKPICRELAQADRRWEAMLDALPAVPTLAVQLWLPNSARDLGWTSGHPGTVVSTPDQLCVWADMSHLLEQEAWPEGRQPASLHYFCGPLDQDRLDAAGQTHPAASREVGRQARDWLDRHMSCLLPGYPDQPAELSSYHRANIDPGERYVSSPAGGNLLRMAASESGFDNLILAGDWTRTAINAGNIEATTMSGMAASRALCGHPGLICGENFLQG